MEREGREGSGAAAHGRFLEHQEGHGRQQGCTFPGNLLQALHQLLARGQNGLLLPVAQVQTLLACNIEIRETHIGAEFVVEPVRLQAPVSRIKGVQSHLTPPCVEEANCS